jgi:membrane protease YdiL (CAAX protease family)
LNNSALTDLIHRKYIKIELEVSPSEDGEYAQYLEELRHTLPIKAVHLEYRGDIPRCCVSFNKKETSTQEIIQFFKSKKLFTGRFFLGNLFHEIIDNIALQGKNQPGISYNSDLPNYFLMLLFWFFCANSISFIVVGFLIRKQKKIMPPPQRPSLIFLSFTGLLGGSAIVLCAVALGYLLPVFHITVHEQEWITQLIAGLGNKPLTFITLCIVIPIAEEYFFRGSIFAYLQQEHGGYWAVFVSSLLFAVVHSNSSGLILYMLYGVVFCLLYHKWKSLVPSVIAHIIINTVVFFQYMP